MKAFFDESGQSGCVFLKKEMLNFTNQPFFALGVVVVENEQDEQILRNKYTDFKKKFSIEGEMKGSNLLIKDRNQELNFFIDSILDTIHFSVNIYDKRLYLSTLLTLGMLGTIYQLQYAVDFYRIASILSFQDDSFFIEYCKYISSPSPESFHNYLLFLSKYKYRGISNETNGIKITADLILKDHNETDFYGDFLSFGWYEDKKITNLINLNALSELIHFVKFGNTKKNSNIEYIHDHIKEFEETFKNELASFGIEMKFEDSKNEELLQLADNLTSIFCHAFVKMKEHFMAKEEWENHSEWDMKLLSKLMNAISIGNIKFTISIPDWASALCVKDMFSDSFPKEMRKNIFFNPLFAKKQEEIMSNIRLFQSQITNVENVIKR